MPFFVANRIIAKIIGRDDGASDCRIRIVEDGDEILAVEVIAFGQVAKFNQGRVEV